MAATTSSRPAWASHASRRTRRRSIACSAPACGDLPVSAADRNGPASHRELRTRGPRLGDHLRSVGCCAQPRLGLHARRHAAGRNRRDHRSMATRTSVIAYDTMSDAMLWSRSLPGSAGALASSVAPLAISIADEVIAFDVRTGDELGRIAHPLPVMHWRGATLVTFRTLPGLPGLERISTCALPSLAETVLTEGPFVPGRVEPIALHLSADGAMRTGCTSRPGSASPSRTRVARCSISMRPAMSPLATSGINPIAAGTGGDIPVRTDGSGQPDGTARGTFVRSTQLADVPAPPVLHGAVDGDRVRLFWEPGAGAGITSFEIRGAALGGSLSTVATLSGSLREWTSPALGPGSYVVQAAASNALGVGPASNEVRFRIGVLTTPDAPDGLMATVVDDQVTLDWQPAATGPPLRATQSKRHRRTWMRSRRSHEQPTHTSTPSGCRTGPGGCAFARRPMAEPGRRRHQ